MINQTLSMIVNGATVPIDVKAMKRQAGETNVYRFDTDFSFMHAGIIVTFRGGSVYALDPALKAALIAAAAPMMMV